MPCHPRILLAAALAVSISAVIGCGSSNSSKNSGATPGFATMVVIGGPAKTARR